MDKENPQKSNLENEKNDKNGPAARRAPVRRTARRSAPVEPVEPRSAQQAHTSPVSPQAHTAQTSAQQAHIAQTAVQQTHNAQKPAQQARPAQTSPQQARIAQNPTQQTRPAQNPAQPLPVSAPREQLRSLQIGSGAEAAAQRDLVPARGGRQTAPPRGISAPLPREIEYETLAVSPEILRRSAAAKRAEPPARRANAAAESGQAAVSPRGSGAEIRPPAGALSKPLPHKASSSASSAKLRRGYKRADEFLPDKPIVTGDKRVITDADRHGYIEGGAVSDKAEENEEFYEIEEPDEHRHRGTALSSLLKAIIYIVFILTASGFLSFFAISVGNDVFAFVKSPEEVTVKIPEYATLDNIAELLKKKGLIEYPFIFKLYSMLRKDDGVFVAGEYEVSPSMNYDQLRYALKGTVEERKEISITIPEGYTVDEIIDLFVNDYGMGTREGFVNAIQNEEFDYWFLKDLKIKDGRKYRLEGYLYPDTYYFFTDWKEKNIIAKFLNNFAAKIDESYKERCDELGMTLDELITLASMIEMESKYSKEYGQISAVFHNRLNNTSVTNGKLESDATIQYVLPERHEDLTVDDLAINSPYNTYKYTGLPPGPITNPTLNAIHSAMYPDNVDYFYFVSRPNGETLFAKTFEEHQKNKQQVAAEKAEK